MAKQDGKGKRKAEAALDPEQSFRSAMRELIGLRWGEVWKAVPVALEGSDIEGVHDVRVASRRLRAAMDVAVECFPEPWYRALHRTAKEITGALGEVRDRDVLLEFLAGEHLRAPVEEWPGLDRLIERIEAERGRAREAIEAYLRGLLEGSVPGEVAERFGAAAAPPDALVGHRAGDERSRANGDGAPDGAGS